MGILQSDAGYDGRADERQMNVASTMNIKRLSDIDVRGKRVFIRADLNVPQDDAGNITDDTRIRASVPGDPRRAGARRRGDGDLAPRPADRRRVEGRGFAGADRPRVFRNCSGDRAARARLGRRRRVARALQPGNVVLLENCRINKGEKKDNDELARKMAKLCDVYVNDAFGTAHRAEATTHGIAKYAPIACAGPLIAAELDALGRALASPAATAGRHRRGLEGVDQAHDPARARREGRCADRRRRHRQHVHPGRGRPHRQVARRARPRRRSEGDPRRVSGQGAGSRRRGRREGVHGDREARRSRRSRTSSPTT